MSKTEAETQEADIPEEETLEEPGFFKTLAWRALTYSAIIAGTLLLLDVVLIMTGLFPPSYQYGHPDLGWVVVDDEDLGKVTHHPCAELGSGTRYEYVTNEDGYRTSYMVGELQGESERFEIAVSGDSHTELCADNELTHFGVMQRELVAGGLDAAVFAHGAGRYSPLQAYLAVERAIGEYAADAFVLNLYSGNDFYDMLRVDDRPHLVADGDGYQIADPIWYIYDEPGEEHPSRVLYAAGKMVEAVGVQSTWTRVRYLSEMASTYDGEGLGAAFRYMNDLRNSSTPEVGYPAAYSAQMLNQQLFFSRFPGAKAESLRRVRYLLETVRERHPDLLLVMSPIPSYQLVQEQPVYGALLRLLDRLPITYESGVAEEQELYDALRVIATESGWLFVDGLAALRSYEGDGRLYNDFDYHILPTASDLIGRAQAEVIRQELGVER